MFLNDNSKKYYNIPVMNVLVYRKNKNVENVFQPSDEWTYVVTFYLHFTYVLNRTFLANHESRKTNSLSFIASATEQQLRS